MQRPFPQLTVGPPATATQGAQTVAQTLAQQSTQSSSVAPASGQTMSISPTHPFVLLFKAVMHRLRLNSDISFEYLSTTSFASFQLCAFGTKSLILGTNHIYIQLIILIFISELIGVQPRKTSSVSSREKLIPLLATVRMTYSKYISHLA